MYLKTGHKPHHFNAEKHKIHGYSKESAHRSPKVLTEANEAPHSPIQPLQRSQPPQKANRHENTKYETMSTSFR